MRIIGFLALAFGVLLNVSCASPPPPNTMERCRDHVSRSGEFMGATAEDRADCERFRQVISDQYQKAQEEHEKEFKAGIAQQQAECNRNYRRGWWKGKYSLYCAGHYYSTNKDKVRIGMTSEQVADLIGPPHKNNRTVTAGLVHEQWVYRNWEEFYLYFENDRLRSWQD
jgi:hypothetical protein